MEGTMRVKVETEKDGKVTSTEGEATFSDDLAVMTVVCDDYR